MSKKVEELQNQLNEISQAEQARKEAELKEKEDWKSLVGTREETIGELKARLEEKENILIQREDRKSTRLNSSHTVI